MFLHVFFNSSQLPAAKKTYKNHATQQTIGPSYFVTALDIMNISVLFINGLIYRELIILAIIYQLSLIPSWSTAFTYFQRAGISKFNEFNLVIMNVYLSLNFMLTIDVNDFISGEPEEIPSNSNYFLDNIESKEPKDVQCPLCPVILPAMVLLDVHLQMVHNSKGLKIVCL